MTNNKLLRYNALMHCIGDFKRIQKPNLEKCILGLKKVTVTQIEVMFLSREKNNGNLEVAFEISELW